MRISSAMRTIEILGQIVRNGATTRSLVEKVQIAEQVFLLGRRLLAVLLRSAPTSLPHLAGRLEEKYRDQFPKASSVEIVTDISEHVFNLFWFAAFAIVKHVATALGDDDLSDTFRAVLARDGSIPNQFYDLAIQLDQATRKMPTERAESLYKSLDKNGFAKALLQSLVVEHIYLYRGPIAERQQICARVGIDIKQVNAKALSPAEKKTK